MKLIDPSKKFYPSRSLFVLILIFGFSCTSDDRPVLPNEPDGKSMFTVEYKRSGDLDKFHEFFSIGEGFLFYGTEKQAPAAFLNDDLTKQKYKFITQKPLEELRLDLTIYWIDVPNFDDAEMEVGIEVFREEELIDSTNFLLISDSTFLVKKFEYKGI